MEGATIEPKDITGGAERAASTQDGLYLYRAGERRAAGELMYNMLCQMVDQKLADQGLLGEIAGFFSDMADDVANQILNTFATDWAAEDAKDSEAWKNTVDASAVAPDNIMFWDAPATQGLYGFFEPLVYRAPRYEKVTVHKWRKVATRGTLTGKVTFNNAAVAQANVQVYDGKFTFTDANGKFTLSQVPEGNYVMKVLKVGMTELPSARKRTSQSHPAGRQRRTFRSPFLTTCIDRRRSTSTCTSRIMSSQPRRIRRTRRASSRCSALVRTALTMRP